MEVKLHHLHIGCADLNLSRDFYVDMLGAEQLKHYHTAYNLEIIQLKLGDFILSLSPKPAGAAGVRELGIYQLALTVDDIAAAMDTLKAKGVRFKGAGLVRPVPGMLAAMFDAPDGVEIELMQAEAA